MRNSHSRISGSSSRTYRTRRWTLVPAPLPMPRILTGTVSTTTVPILEEILRLGRAAGAEDVRYELIPPYPGTQRCVLAPSDCPRIRERRAMIPAPRAFVVSGRLDEIRHGLGRFRLLMGGGRWLAGQLDRSELDVELLRPSLGEARYSSGDRALQAERPGTGHRGSANQPKRRRRRHLREYARRTHGRARDSPRRRSSQGDSPCRSNDPLGRLAWRRAHRETVGPAGLITRPDATLPAGYEHSAGPCPAGRLGAASVRSLQSG